MYVSGQLIINLIERITIEELVLKSTPDFFSFIKMEMNQQFSNL